MTFEQVRFGYTRDRDVLTGIDLHIPAGRKFALVGYSGSGKTTLAKLIPRFYQLERGSIKIDGRDIADYPLHVLRQNISMVLQDSILFEGTLRENLEIGRQGASLEEIIDACIKANIHDTIANLPDGYETLVREQGINFSAGQRQRLAIARAILRDAPILILDEPTANLDVESESEVMHAINILITGRTVLTISHRLSTLGNVDEILVMDHGQIVERGTFKELKRKQGLFATLLEEQNHYNLDRDEDDEALYRSAFSATRPGLPVIQLGSLPRTRAIIGSTARMNNATASLLADTDANLRRIPVAQSPNASSNGNGRATSSNGYALDIPTSKRDEPNRNDMPRRHATPTRARVRVQVDGQFVSEHSLSQTICTIGRFPTSDIHIPLERVSRFHAIIRWENGAWIIGDAESLNGLICQGQRIDQLALVDGDRVHLDSTIVLQYEER